MRWTGGGDRVSTQLGPEAMHRLMQGCLATAQQVIPSYGGTPTHITGKGLVALFGAPLAHEDHARRAVLAAVALQQALQASPRREPCCVARHRGAHRPGGGRRSGRGAPLLYTAVGETLKLAGRLRQRAAPGAILLSAATQQLVQAEVQVDEGQPWGGGR